MISRKGHNAAFKLHTSSLFDCFLRVSDTEPWKPDKDDMAPDAFVDRELIQTGERGDEDRSGGKGTGDEARCLAWDGLEVGTGIRDMDLSLNNFRFHSFAIVN